MIDNSLCKLFILEKENTFSWVSNLPPIPLPTRGDVDFYRREIQGQPRQPAQEVYEDIYIEEVFEMLDSFINNIRDERIARELNYFSSRLERVLLENSPGYALRYRRMINRRGRYD